MIEVRISEIFTPYDLQYNKENLYIVIRTSENSYKLILDHSKLTPINHENADLDIELYYNDKVLSSKSENFDFLKTSSKWQELDDWVRFDLFSKSENLLKIIRVRFTGKRVVQNTRMYRLNTQELEKVSEKSEESSPKSEFSTSKNQDSENDLNFERKENEGKAKPVLKSENKEISSKCKYLNNISNIEISYKSIDCTVKRIECYDAIDFYNPTFDNQVVLELPCRLETENKVYYATEEKHLIFIEEFLSLQERVNNYKYEEMKLLEKMSSVQEDRHDQMDQARKSIKNDFIDNIEQIENMINASNERNEDLEDFLKSLLKKNEEIEKEKIGLENDFEVLLKEQSEVKNRKISDKNALFSMKNLEKQDLFKIYKEKSDVLKKRLNDFEREISEISKDVSLILKESFEIENSKEELLKENRKLKSNEILQHPFPGYESRQKSHPKLDDILLKRQSLKEETNQLIKKINQSSKSLKQSGLAVQKLLSPQADLPLYPITALESTQSSMPLSHLSLYTYLSSHTQSLNLLQLKLALSKTTHRSLSSVTKDLTEIQDLQQDLYTKIACEINPVYSGQADLIDAALSDFLNKNRSVLDKNIEKKAYGVYSYGNRTLQLFIHNKNLVAKSGGSFIPIKTFLSDLKKRSTSLNKA